MYLDKLTNIFFAAKDPKKKAKTLKTSLELDFKGFCIILIIIINDDFLFNNFIIGYIIIQLKLRFLNKFF